MIAINEFLVMVESSLIKMELATTMVIVPPKSNAIVVILVFYSKGQPLRMEVSAPRTR
jgi:hypothetical protein